MTPHPVATAEQHEHEKAALGSGPPGGGRGTDAVRAEWLEKEQPSPVMRDCFDWAFEEVMFSAAIWSSNQDPLHPKVTCITRLEHEVDGRADPGHRWGIDNPDSIYRVIPISGDERYEIRGRVGEHRMTENYFTLWDDSMGTEGAAQRPRPRGTTTARSCHRRCRPGRRPPEPRAVDARRPTSSTSATSCSTGRADDPNWLEIVRLGGRPPLAPLTDDEQAQRTAEYMHKFADFSHGLSKGMTMGRPNRFHLAHSADTGRGAAQPGVRRRPLPASTTTRRSSST